MNKLLNVLGGYVDSRKLEHCIKCNTETLKRLVRDRKHPYYACSICLENNCKKHRKNKWKNYLAQKANSRKREGSEILTEDNINKLYEEQSGVCKISGVKFDIEHKWNRPSLDRIDNNKGYTVDNIQLVTWIVNHTRGELSIEEYLAMCKKVTKNNLV